MTPTHEDLPDPQHISTVSVSDRDVGEYQADIQFDDKIIVTASYEIGNPINIVVMSPNEGSIVDTHEYESPRQNALQTRQERCLSVVQENAGISLPRNLLVTVSWRPADGITVIVFNPHSEEHLGTYEFDDPVNPEERGVNAVCNECGEVQAHQHESDPVCINCSSMNY